MGETHAGETALCPTVPYPSENRCIFVSTIVSYGTLVAKIGILRDSEAIVIQLSSQLHTRKPESNLILMY